MTHITCTRSIDANDNTATSCTFLHTIILHITSTVQKIN